MDKQRSSRGRAQTRGWAWRRCMLIFLNWPPVHLALSTYPFCLICAKERARMKTWESAQRHLVLYCNSLHTLNIFINQKAGKGLERASISTPWHSNSHTASTPCMTFMLLSLKSSNAIPGYFYQFVVSPFS